MFSNEQKSERSDLHIVVACAIHRDILIELFRLIAECENGEDNINMKCYKQANKNVSFRIYSIVICLRRMHSFIPKVYNLLIYYLE